MLLALPTRCLARIAVLVLASSGIVVARAGAPADGAVPSPSRSGEPRWTVLAGKPEAPGMPAVMVCAASPAGERVFLVYDNKVAEYRVDADAWIDDVVHLPARVGSGVAVTSDAAGRLIVLRGGDSRDFWRIDPNGGAVEALPSTPDGVGRGGAVEYDAAKDRVFALRGGETTDVWMYDVKSRAWSAITDSQKNLTRIGHTSGDIMVAGGKLYGWADHHVKLYDWSVKGWRNFMSFGFRPWWSGSTFARDRRTEARYVTLGKDARTLAIFEPIPRRWDLLRPRLPAGLSGEGERGFVADVGGRPHLFVYDAAGANALYRIALADLERITPESPASDVGSAWTSRHEEWGASLVRPDTGGLLGSVGDKWYFTRFKGMRFIDPATNRWSHYPGVPVVGRLPDGLAATSDGASNVYAFAGGGKQFVRANADTLEGERLPDPDLDALVGAQLAFHGGLVHALMGGETLAHRVFDPTKGEWEKWRSLPDEATPVGLAGSGLVVSEDRLVAVSGKEAWRLDAFGYWSKAADLPFAVSADGGMVAADPSSARIFLIEGGGSRRLGIVDLRDPSQFRAVEFPDAVSIRGNRSFVWRDGDRSKLVVMRGHDTNEIFVIDLAALEAN